VCGQRRELYPQNSIYNLVLDLDWIGSGGFVDSCGGDALFRRSVLEQTKGYDSTLIAGEEPDLCRRIRSEGLKVFRIDQLMTLHDLNITSLGQYWKRAVRTGYAYAEVSSRYRYTSDPLWRGESIRNFKQVSALVLMCLALIYFLFTQSALILGTTLIIFSLIFMLLINRSMRICSWKTNERSTQFLYVLHSYFQQLPIFQGQINYFLNQLLRQKKNLIEYKGN
jgi:GT2 family glycosyltransferase